MNVLIKNMETKNNNKIVNEYNSNKNDFIKTHHQIYSKDKEFEIKKIKRKKFSATNNNFNLNKNNNIIFRHNTFNKFKEKDVDKEKKDNNQIRKNQKTMIIEQDLSKEVNTMSFYYMNNINTNKKNNNNNSNQKNNQNLNKGSTSRKESKKISKNLSRENMHGGGNNFLQGGTQRKKIHINDVENNNHKILKLYDFNNMNKEDNTIINNTNDVIFTTNNNKNVQEKKNSANNVILNSGNKYKVDKKISLVDKFSNNIDYYRHHNQIKIDTKNINNSINNNIIIQKNSIPYKAQSNDKNMKNYINLSSNNSKEKIAKNIKNIIIENSNKNNINYINHFKSDVNVYNSYKTNNINNNNIKTKNSKEGIKINGPLEKSKPNEFNGNTKLKILNISSIQNKIDKNNNKNKNGLNFECYNLNNKNILKNKNNELILNNINKNISNLITNNIKNVNNTKSNNIYITYINNTSLSNADFPKVKNTANYNSNININKSNTNSNIEKLKNSSKKSFHSINSITKLNTLQNEDIKKTIKYNNYKYKVNFSSPKIPSIYDRHNTKPHLRRPLTNNQKNRNNDKTYSPKLNSIPKYIQTENNNSNINITNNNNIYINRLEVYENCSISSRKDNIFSKINNNLKNNTNYINILNKRKLSAKNQNEKGNSFLKLIENKDKKKEKEKEKDIVNLTKRRPRKSDNEVNNIFTEISNIHNNKNSFFNFVFKKNNINSNNGILNSKLLDNFNNKEEKNKKYSFINIIKPKAISQQKRYNNNKEMEEKENIQESKMARDLKSLTFISKDKKKNTSLLHKKGIMKLIHMMDEFNNSKSKSKSKKKNKSYNNNNNKRGASAIKDRKKLTKFKFNYLGEEDNILDNVIQNNITKYSIYILSKYYDNFKKVGLTKIKLYDKNNNEIFIIDSNSNITNNGEENVNYLFNVKKHYYNNKPFISDFKDYLYINFYISFKKTNIIKYIKIINYENKEEKISPVKEIKICHGKKKIYEGILKINYNNNINIIDITENKNNSENKDFQIFTIIRKRGNSAHTNNINNKIYNSNYKRNNTRSYSTFRANSGKKSNKIPKKQLIKINSERNITNKDKENVITENKYTKYLGYHNTDIEDNNNLGNKNLIKNICKTINYNNNNEFDNNIFIRERFISDNNIRKENRIHESINIHKFNLNNYNTQKEEELNNNNLSYIKFKKIKLILSSNYGHPNCIGLTGLEFYDINNKLIDIETAETVGALPKDLHTVYNNENDNRIFENIFNGENNIDDSYNMWVTLFDSSNKDLPFIELSFNKYIYLSKINIFNYNKKNELDICLKTVDLILDDKYYNTIHLRQGLGDINNENIIQKENSNINNYKQKEINDENNNKDSKNYCQEIYFPINNDYYDKIYKNRYNNINIFENELKVEFASNKYEQSYETPFMPNGHIIKFQLINNFYKGKIIENIFTNANTNSANNILIKNYNYIGINIVNIFDENGNDLLTQKNIKYKIISNKEMIISDKHKIILNCSQNEDSNNNIYFVFENPVNISYIEINPFSFFGSFYNNNKNDKNNLNSAKDIKIFCDTNIIFEGELYNYQPTLILFTSNDNILQNLDKNYLTKKSFDRVANENINEDCYSLVFNY